MVGLETARVGASRGRENATAAGANQSGRSPVSCTHETTSEGGADLHHAGAQPHCRGSPSLVRASGEESRPRVEVPMARQSPYLLQPIGFGRSSVAANSAARRTQNVFDHA